MNASRRFYTYLHCRPDGTPFYVGKGRGRRAYSLVRRNPHHKNIVAKYGKENIVVLVFYCYSERQALKDEIQMIAQLRREGHVLTNKTDGGDGVSNPTNEVRIKIGSGQRGKKRSADHCEKLSKARAGQVFHDGYSETMAAAMKKRYENPVEREKTSAAMKIACANPSERERKSAASKRMWGNNEYRTRKISSLLALNPKGEDCSWAKLTAKKVKEIRLSRKSGISLAELSCMYGISQSSVSQIANRRSWKSVI